MFGKFGAKKRVIFKKMNFSYDEIKTVIQNCKNYEELVSVCLLIVDLYPLSGDGMSLIESYKNRRIHEFTRIQSLTKIKQLRN